MSKQGTESPSAGAKPRWNGSELGEPKWVLDAVAFNLAMQISGDDQHAAQARVREEIAVVRRMYSSPRTRSALQVAAQAREA